MSNSDHNTDALLFDCLCHIRHVVIDLDYAAKYVPDFARAGLQHRRTQLLVLAGDLAHALGVQPEGETSDEE